MCYLNAVMLGICAVQRRDGLYSYYHSNYDGTACTAKTERGIVDSRLDSRFSFESRLHIEQLTTTPNL